MDLRFALRAFWISSFICLNSRSLWLFQVSFDKLRRQTLAAQCDYRENEVNRTYGTSLSQGFGNQQRMDCVRI